MDVVLGKHEDRGQGFRLQSLSRWPVVPPSLPLKLLQPQEWTSIPTLPPPSPPPPLHHLTAGAVRVSQQPVQPGCDLPETSLRIDQMCVCVSLWHHYEWSIVRLPTSLMMEHLSFSVLPWHTPILWEEREEEGLALCLALWLVYSTLQKIRERLWQGWWLHDGDAGSLSAATGHGQSVWCPILECAANST